MFPGSDCGPFGHAMIESQFSTSRFSKFPHVPMPLPQGPSLILSATCQAKLEFQPLAFRSAQIFALVAGGIYAGGGEYGGGRVPA